MTKEIDLQGRLRKAQKERRELKKHLETLSSTVSDAVDALDKEMEKPSSFERGRAVAAILNRLNYANDVVKRFALGQEIGTKRPCPHENRWGTCAICNGPQNAVDGSSSELG